MRVRMRPRKGLGASLHTGLNLKSLCLDWGCDLALRWEQIATVDAVHVVRVGIGRERDDRLSRHKRVGSV